MKKPRNMIRVLLVTLVINLILTACINKNPDIKIISEEETSETRELVDQKGRRVVLPKEINRVVTTYLPATNIVFAVGGQEKLVAVNNKVHSNKFLSAIYPEIVNVEEIGNKQGINIEAIIASRPDVVIMYPVNDSDAICKQLESHGIATVVIEPESIEQLKEAFLIIGELVNCDEQAQALVDYYDETLAIIEDRINSIPLDKREKVFLAGGEGLLSTTSKDMFQHYVIEKAGGRDVASDLTGGWNKISVEQLIQWDPEVIVAVQYCKEGIPELIKENPQLQSLKAVRDNQLYRFPSNLGPWDFPAPRAILGILWLSQRIYPEAFYDIDIPKKIDAFHTTFYSKSFTELGGRIDDKGITSKTQK